MISRELAAALREAGLTWTPASGDRFQINGADFAGETFTVSEMTIEAHHFPTGTVLGFNGTTEWALDSVALEDALWLPREHQLRDLLRGAFRSLERRPEGEGARHVVTAHVEGKAQEFTHEDAEEAYGAALLALIRSATSDT